MFYVLLAAVPVTAALGLVVFGRAVDAASGGRHDAFGRLQALVMAVVLALLVVASAVTSPLT